jgi:hypothetical protein
LSYEDAVVFDAPVSEREGMKVPFHHSGINLYVDGNRYRFSFARPGNTSGELDGAPDAIEITKTWRVALGGPVKVEARCKGRSPR